LDPLEWRPAPPPFWTGNTGWEPDAHVDEAAIPALLELTNHSDPFVRGYAAHTLGDLGQKAWVAVPRLTEMLKDDGMAASNYLLVRRLAVLALLRIDYKVYRVEHDKLGERWFWPPHFWPQFNNAVSEETEPPPEADKERP
jgi:hypothetical protein